MIFKETILLESAAALLGVVGGSGAAPSGTQDEEDVGDTGEDEVEAEVEVEADVGEQGVAVNGATVDTDEGEAGAVVTVALLEAGVQDADSGVTETVDPV